MRKIIIVILLLSAGISVALGIIKYNEYNSKPKEKNSTEELNKKIEEVEVEIKEKKEEIEKVKLDSKKVLDEVQTWQKKVESIEKHFG